MKNNKKGFTLIELLFSISIMSIIILGIGGVLIKMSQNFYESNYHINTFKNIINLQNDIIKNSYSSGFILTGTSFPKLILENKYNSGGILIGIFDKNMDFLDYKLNISNETISYNNIGYFYINETILNDIKNTPANIDNYTFNKGKVFNDINIYDFDIIEYNSNILRLDIKVFKNITKFLGKNISEINIAENENILDFNLFF